MFTYWRTFYHDGKLAQHGEGGGRTPSHFHYLLSQVKLWCTLRGQIPPPPFYSTPICTLCVQTWYMYIYLPYHWKKCTRGACTVYMQIFCGFCGHFFTSTGLPTYEYDKIFFLSNKKICVFKSKGSNKLLTSVPLHPSLLCWLSSSMANPAHLCHETHDKPIQTGTPISSELLNAHPLCHETHDQPIQTSTPISSSFSL